MTILAVDNNGQRLRKLIELLGEVFPDSHIEATQDPLMAGKYAYNNPVDLMLTALVMRPLDGVEMTTFMRRRIPDLKIILMADAADLDEAIIDDDSIVLTFPVTKETLLKAVEQAFGTASIHM